MENNSKVALPPDLTLEEISEICERLQIQLTTPCWDSGDDLVFLFFDWGKVWMTYWTSSAVPRYMSFAPREQIKRSELNTGLDFYKKIPTWVIEALNYTLKARLIYMRQRQDEAWAHIASLMGKWAQEELDALDNTPS